LYKKIESQFIHSIPFHNFWQLKNLKLKREEKPKSSYSMETKAVEATNNRLYEDFEPYCKWLTKEGQKILEIDLKGTRFP
jgi:hypothetical protein